MTTPYESLGVPPNADAATIKRAYRKRARETHPDKGGKTAEFQAVSRAYALLSDHVARERYDRTGAQDDGLSMGMRRIATLCERLQQIIMHDLTDVDHMDLMAVLDKQLKSEQAAGKAVIATNRKRLAKFERAVKRIKTEDPFLPRMLGELAKNAQQQIAGVEAQLVELAALRETLKRYRYEFDVRPTATMATYTVTSSALFGSVT